MDDGASPPIECSICGHNNPAVVKVCSGCGGQVGLLPEPPDAAPAARSAPPAPRFSEPVSRPSSRTTAGVLLLMLIVALALYAYTQFSVYFFSVPEPIERALRPSQRGQLDPAPSTAGAGDSTRSEPAAAGVIERKGATDDVMPARMNESASPAGPPVAVVPAKVMPEEAAPAAANPSRVDHRGAGSPQALSTSPRACTEAMSALGLCSANDASAPAAHAPTADTRKAAGEAGPSRQQVCTDAAAALALCVVNQPSRRE